GKDPLSTRETVDGGSPVIAANLLVASGVRRFFRLSRSRSLAMPVLLACLDHTCGSAHGEGPVEGGQHDPLAFADALAAEAEEAALRGGLRHSLAHALDEIAIRGHVLGAALPGKDADRGVHALAHQGLELRLEGRHVGARLRLDERADRFLRGTDLLSSREGP